MHSDSSGQKTWGLFSDFRPVLLCALVECGESWREDASVQKEG